MPYLRIALTDIPHANLSPDRPTPSENSSQKVVDSFSLVFRSSVVSTVDILEAGVTVTVMVARPVRWPLRVCL